MTLWRSPLFIINCKNFPEASGRRVVELAQSAERVAHDLGLEIVVAPPTPWLAQVAASVSIPVVAQHTDPALPGNTTGAIVPELLREAGVQGSLVNHSEHRLSKEVIRAVLARLTETSLIPVVCGGTVPEIEELARYHPPYLAIEPPELIGSGTAVSRAQPEVITRSVAAVAAVDSSITLICGAGIVAADDVRRATELGARGILVASGVVKAPLWAATIERLARPLRN